MNLAYVFEHGDAVLVATFLLLISMSALSWYVIFWKGWFVSQERSSIARFKSRVMGKERWQASVSAATATGYTAQLLEEWEKIQPALQGAEEQARKDLLVMHLTQKLDAIRAEMDKGLTLLASIGSSAPFIGLFGTVWGIYGALTDIAAAGNASLNVVAGPMGEALVATAVGLFAAIPAVLAYNAYVRANRLLVQDYRHIAERLTLYSQQQVHTTQTDSLKLVSGD